LNAVCYNSEEQKIKLQSTLDNSKEYNRAIPLAFIKSSDAHDHEKVGSRVTWIKLEKLNFESLKDAFSNPSELISSQEPNTAKILKRVLSLDNTFGISDIERNKQLFCTLVCALNNTKGGNILIGVTEDKKQIGIKVDYSDKDHELKLIKQIIPYFEMLHVTGTLKNCAVSFYPLEDDKVIMSVRIDAGNDLLSIKEDNRVYSIVNKKVVQLSAPEIQTIIEEKTSKQMEQKIKIRIESIESDCRLTRHLFYSMPIIKNFEMNSKRTRFDYKIAEPIQLNPDLKEYIRKIFERSDGHSIGNVFVVSNRQIPRLKDAYLRYTVPICRVPKLGKELINKDTIFITSVGGVFFAQSDYPYYSEEIDMHVTKIYSFFGLPYGMKFITCFLKSSFFLWYVFNKFGNLELLKDEIFKNIRLPILNVENPECAYKIEQIEKNFDDIRNLEKFFLRTFNRIKETEDKIKYVDKHNSSVDPLAYSIDHLIYSLIGLNSSEINLIEENLRLNNIYIPSLPLPIKTEVINIKTIEK
jgi:hypothetical protein